MKKVSVNIALNPEEINEKLTKVRELKDMYLDWCINGSSPAEFPEEILYVLRVIDVIDNHFLLLTKKIDNVKSRERGEEICYPDVDLL